MTTPTFVHCLFEQSGTFRDQFRNINIPAEDYDIQNDYGKTDHIIDLFKEIDSAYYGKPSIFDSMQPDHLLMALFPCIYFCSDSMQHFSGTSYNYRNFTADEITSDIIDRAQCRYLFYTRLLKLICICQRRSLRLIIENPATQPHYLLMAQNFPLRPAYVDRNRTLRGDYFTKPTAYWAVNCELSLQFTMDRSKEIRTIEHSRKGDKAGECSKERSEISPRYAYHFIHDQILGIVQPYTQTQIPF